MKMTSLRASLCNPVCITRAMCVRWIASSLALLAMTMSAEAHDALPREFEGVGITEHLGQTLPLDLTFRNEAGEVVPLRSFFDGKRPVVLALAYYECPMLCGLLLNGLMEGFKKLAWTAGEEYQFVNVSIDPKETSDLAAAKKQAYLAAMPSARPEPVEGSATASGWHFLVGDEAPIRTLADQIGFQYRYDAEQKQYAHAAAVFVLTPDGTLARYLYGIEFRPRDLRLALLEATNGKIGNTVDRLLMFCYHYDPKTRKYALLATRMMRFGGGVAVTALVFLVLRLRRSEKKRLC